MTHSLRLVHPPSPPSPSAPSPTSPTNDALTKLEIARAGGPSHIILTSLEARALASLVIALSNDLASTTFGHDRLKGVPHP